MSEKILESKFRILQHSLLDVDIPNLQKLVTRLEPEIRIFSYHLNQPLKGSHALLGLALLIIAIGFTYLFLFLPEYGKTHIFNLFTKNCSTCRINLSLSKNKKKTCIQIEAIKRDMDQIFLIKLHFLKRDENKGDTLYI
jgi:hypothetical protein